MLYTRGTWCWVLPPSILCLLTALPPWNWTLESLTQIWVLVFMPSFSVSFFGLQRMLLLADTPSSNFSDLICLLWPYVVVAAAAESWFAAETSTGYLEDVIAGWGIWCKQHNLPSYSQDQKVNYVCMVSFSLLFLNCYSHAFVVKVFEICSLINHRKHNIWLIRKTCFQHSLQQLKSSTVCLLFIFKLDRFCKWLQW